MGLKTKNVLMGTVHNQGKKQRDLAALLLFFFVCRLDMKRNILSTRVWQVTLMDYVHFWINWLYPDPTWRHSLNP